MVNPTTMKYGDYEFIPVPLIRIGKEFDGDVTIVGSRYTLTLDGTLVASPTGGIRHIDELQDELRAGFDQDGKLFEVKCGSDTLIKNYPRINSIEFEETSNNWVQTADFIIELEFDEELSPTGDGSGYMPPYISEASEEWTIEFVDDTSYYRWELDSETDASPYQLRLSHTVSAKGKSHYDNTGLTMPAWQQAKNYVTDRLGYDSDIVEADGVLNINAALFSPFNHVRTNQIDVLSGNFSVTENWLVINPTGEGVAGKATEDFTVNIENSLDVNIVRVSIEGTIQGLELVDYDDYEVLETKWDNAYEYWSIVEGRLRERASFAADDILIRSINPTPLSRSVGHNPTNGIITYSYEFDDRPINCISGALIENIQINDSNPVDIFASLPVLGRTPGPVLQDMETVTSAVREVSIEALMPLPTGCPTSAANVAAIMGQSPKSQVAALLCAFQADLENNYGQVFKNNDTESWNPKTGQYSRNVAWTFSSCDGTPPTLCD